METLYSAYNESSKRVLSPRLSVVDAATEPMKVLKILMEGLSPHARNGIWLVNFKGIPVARSYSAFDLVYLDNEHRVVHAIEISKSSEFTPFKGDPSSALILPATSVARAKTFTGDRLTISEAGAHSTGEPVADPTPKPKRVKAQTSRVVPAVSPKTFNVPGTHAPDLRSPAATAVSGRLMRRGSLALKPSPETTPSVSPALAQEAEAVEVRENNVVPISIANEQVEAVVVTMPEATPVAAPTPLPSTALVKAGVKEAASRDLEVPVAAAEVPEIARPGELVTADAGSVAVAPKISKKPAKSKKKQEQSERLKWDVQLLYSLFPELSPSYRPEFQAPVVNFTADVLKKKEEKLSTKIQILSWFYPDLELETVHARQREHRRAPRISDPGLVGYYFSGGHAQPHMVRNLSVMGFYMITDERWLPGTVIRVTLQIVDSTGDDPRDTLTVLSRVVNWGPDGGGFEFVMPGFVD